MVPPTPYSIEAVGHHATAGPTSQSAWNSSSRTTFMCANVLFSPMIPFSAKCSRTCVPPQWASSSATISWL